MTDLTNDLTTIGKIIADECNVKRVVIDGVVAYEEPPLSERTKRQLEQFNEIYKE